MKHDARGRDDPASNDMAHENVDDAQDEEEEVGGGGLISRSTLRHLISALVAAPPAVTVEAASPQQPSLEPSTTPAGGPGGPSGDGGGGGGGDGGSSVGVGSGMGGGAGGGGDAEGNDNEDTPRVRAGCVLWDLSARAEYAELLIELGLLAAVGKVLSSDDADADMRYAEVVLGLLGNMATHPSVRPAFYDSQVGRAALCSALGTFLSCTDSAVLREGCRLLAMLCRDIHDDHDPDGGDGGGDAAPRDRGEGTPWLVGLLATEGFASKVLFILHNTLDVDLLGQAWYLTYMSCYASSHIWRALDGASSSSSLLSMDQAFLTSLDTRTHMLQDLMHTTVGGRTGLEYCLRALEVHISRRSSAHEHAAPQASLPPQSPSSTPTDAAATHTNDAPGLSIRETAVVIEQQQQQQRLLAALEWLLVRSYTDHQDNTTHDTGAALPQTHPPPTPPQPGWDVDTPISGRSTAIHAAGGGGGVDVSRPTPASMDTPHLLLLSSAAVVVADLVDLLVQAPPPSQQQQQQLKQAQGRGAEASNPTPAAVLTHQATVFVSPSGGMPQADGGSAQALLDASITLVQQCAVRVSGSVHPPSGAAPVQCAQATSSLLEALRSFTSLLLVCVQNYRYAGVLHKLPEADKVRLLGRINSLADQLETSLRSDGDGGSVDCDEVHPDRGRGDLIVDEEGWSELIRPIVAAVRVLEKWTSESG